jgi:leucyl/phenylalanyl-tRNA--protein transferase
MPIYRLINKPIFPPPELAEPDGLLAVGGDLSPERLLEAYRLGIFPWYAEEDPILWWSPEPRLIMEPDSIHVSKSLRKIIRQRRFEIRIDFAFEDVIENCAQIARKEARGTWITLAIKDAYIQLFELGFAHSFESWQDNKLVGGLYGISLGKCFFGESMFSLVSNASKVALVALANVLEEWDFDLIDCQVSTHHLLNMGAFEVERNDFLQRLRLGLQHPTRRGSWQDVKWPGEKSRL